MIAKVGDTVELSIEGLATGGDGIARLDGLTVFVALAAPGDRVRARVHVRKRRWARAEISELLSAGPARRAPACRYFGRCGGCSWMHLAEDEQRRAREQVLRSSLERIGGLSDLPHIEHIHSPRALGYRALARLAHADGATGFRARASHEVVDVSECLVLDAATQHALEELRRASPRRRGETQLRGFGSRVEMGEDTYQVGPDSFFQANASLWRDWRAAVARACGVGELAVELYAGVGFYTMDLERAFRHVVAVERGPACRDLRRNVRVEVVEAAAESWATKHLPDLRPDLVLLNPPRTGCHPDVARALAECRAARLVYVSCNPTTLARDLARLGSRFRLTRLVLLEALPQTHHVECIAVVRLG